MKKLKKKQLICILQIIFELSYLSKVYFRQEKNILKNDSQSTSFKLGQNIYTIMYCLYNYVNMLLQY